MSDIQRDREERQHVIEVLKSWDGYFIGYTSDEVQEALRYAIASIKTDLKYDLLYEETSGQADKPTTKNDLAVDAVSRAEVLKLMQDNWHTHNGDWAMQESMDDIRALPAVTPQEPQTFKWCTDCREYDQEKHCCHRWSKAIRDTVEEMKQEQEPILDKVRAEIESKLDNINRLYNQDNQYDDGAIDSLQYALDIIDKYMESEDKE